MKKYILNQINSLQYFLVNLDYYSILNYLDEIENEYLIKTNKGELVVDQLLVTGNGKNRFISCNFTYGKIELETAKYIEGTYEHKKTTTELLKQHYESLKYSILTDCQLKLIMEGHVI